MPVDQREPAPPGRIVARVVQDADLHTFEVTCGGASATFDAHGSAGAAYAGLYSTAGDLPAITVECVSGCGGVGFATGEYGWSD